MDDFGRPPLTREEQLDLLLKQAMSLLERVVAQRRELRRVARRAIAAMPSDGSKAHKAIVDLRVVLEHHDRAESAEAYLDDTER